MATESASSLALERLGWASIAAGGALFNLAGNLSKMALPGRESMAPPSTDVREIEAALSSLREHIAVAEKYLSGDQLALVRRVKAALLGAAA